MDQQLELELVNIGSRDRRARLALGILALAMGVVLAALFVAGGVVGWWRALVFIPFAIGISLILEARTGVCPMLASKGQRNFDGLFATRGLEIEDRALADRIRRAGRLVMLQALVGGIALTVVYVLIPA